ncbi:VasL domain-containing protein [Cedecea neteri]|uniref:VasL domain-containing protein n=1 Tax=Cedecea neteri TaxID=158822 RepID=UPI0004F5AB7B|nr:VasL domain-containing protein [Cedecea neteri]AIR66373.1 membrane protein [Cedecea neteri]
MNKSHQIKTGGDPRALPDYALLRDELAKLSHPARPDVDWNRVEQLSLSLFRQNGVELQTAAWYTLARTRLNALAGLNEGLALLEALLVHQWGIMWPQPVHARMEILAGFSHRLQAQLRTLALRYSDLPQVYQAEQHLNALRDVLQRLELKNASQMEGPCRFMQTAAVRLENAEVGHGESPAVVLPVSLSQSLSEPARHEPLIYVTHEKISSPRIAVVNPDSVSRKVWKSFSAGMLTMLLIGAAGLLGWRQLSPLPLVPNEAALEKLSQLPPLWLQDYGFALAERGTPEQVEGLKAQWTRQISGNALTGEALSGWHQGMDGLSNLTRRLNALDERKGKYLTGSELKSMVFTITQHFSRSVPLEERLYLLSQVPAGEPLPDGQLAQTDMQFRQLLNRYALIKSQAE